MLPAMEAWIIKNIIYLFIYLYFWLLLFLLGLFSSCITWASHCGDFSVVEHGLQGSWASVVAARGLQITGSIIVAHGLSCSTACGIFLDQGSNLCLLLFFTTKPPEKPQKRGFLTTGLPGKSLEHFYHSHMNLCANQHSIPIFPLNLPAPGNHQSTFHLCGFAYSGHLMHKKLCNMQPFVSDFFH